MNTHEIENAEIVLDVLSTESQVKGLNAFVMPKDAYTKARNLPKITNDNFSILINSLNYRS